MHWDMLNALTEEKDNREALVNAETNFTTAIYTRILLYFGHITVLGQFIRDSKDMTKH